MIDDDIIGVPAFGSRTLNPTETIDPRATQSLQFSASYFRNPERTSPDEAYSSTAAIKCQSYLPHDGQISLMLHEQPCCISTRHGYPTLLKPEA